MSHTILGHCDLDLWPSFKYYCVWSISLLFFEVRIPNLVYMQLGMGECHLLFLGHCDLDL